MAVLKRAALNALRPMSCSTTRPSRPTLQTSHLSSTAANPDTNIEEITIAPIADIFDAPTTLGASTAQLLRREILWSAPMPSQSISASASTSTPFTLPPPLVFEGPARPRTSASRRRRSLPPRPLSTRQHHTPARPRSLQDDTIWEVFDGPSRISRNPYGSSSRSSGTGKITAVALAGVVGLLGVTTLRADSTSTPSTAM